MKKSIITALALSLFLTSCGANATAEQEDDTTTTQKIEQQIPSDMQIAVDAADQRAAYYQQLVTELQKEILAMKTELYETTVLYENRIKELEAALNPEAESPFQYTVENGKATLTAYVGKEQQVEIPETLGGAPVCAIGDKAFENNAEVTAVTLPEGVTTIGWFAFSGCVGLREITLPQSLATVSYGAFQNCDTSLIVHCVHGSYAEQYAQSYGFTVKN